MLPMISALFAAALALASFAATPHAAGRCSIMPFPFTRDAASTQLLGHAAPDTMLAGPGIVEVGDDADGRSEADTRPVYGQVVRIDRFGGADSVRLAQAFAQTGVARVVIVPWSYGPSCEPIAWRGSARWVPPGEPGMFNHRLRLRPTAHWVEGLPTLDAFMPYHQPYPLAASFRRGHGATDANRAQRWLTAAEYFELYSALPDWDAIRRDPEAARETIARWEGANPELARMHPATEVLRFARVAIDHEIGQRRSRAITPPVDDTTGVTPSVSPETIAGSP